MKDKTDKSKTIPIARKLNTKFQNFPKYWFNNNALLTHFLNSLHVVFPEGERFFIRSVNQAVKQVDDPMLKERVKGFIAQEVQHGSKHNEFWKVLEEQGLDPEQFQEFYKDHAYNKVEKIASNFLGKDICLSVTVALEHYTAILAEMAFSEDELLRAMPNEMQELLLWHATEEIEHKSVAFDVLHRVNDSYVTRTQGMIIASIALGAYAVIGQAYFIKQDKDVTLSKLISDIPDFTKFTFKMFKSIGKDLFRYMIPGFHPDDIDNEYLIDRYLESNSDKFEVLKKAS